MRTLAPSSRKYKHFLAFNIDKGHKRKPPIKKYNNLSKIHVIYVANLIAGMDI